MKEDEEEKKEEVQETDSTTSELDKTDDPEDKEEEEEEEVIKIEALNATPKTYGLDVVKNTGIGQRKLEYPEQGYAIVTKVNWNWNKYTLDCGKVTHTSPHHN